MSTDARVNADPMTAGDRYIEALRRVEARVSTLIEDMIRLHERKGADYDGHHNLAFYNIRQAEEQLLIEPVDAALVRASDKWTRVCNLRMREKTNGGGPAVQGETLEDSMVDGAAYLLIAKTLHEEREYTR